MPPGPPETSLRRSWLIPSLLPITGTPLLGPSLPLLVSINSPDWGKFKFTKVEGSCQTRGERGMHLSFPPYLQENQGCTDLQAAHPAPPPMECPWVGVLGRGRRKGFSRGLFRVPDPDTVPKGPVSCDLSLWGRKWGPQKDGSHLSTPC